MESTRYSEWLEQLQPGSLVFIQKYMNISGKTIFLKDLVKKITKTQIQLHKSPQKFRRQDGSSLGSSAGFSSNLVDIIEPTDEIEKLYKLQNLTLFVQRRLNETLDQIKNDDLSKEQLMRFSVFLNNFERE
tara:strand:- start:61 stop:453 length:393 start_codon:yes stop_codon:yes gene_type:complete